MRKSELDKTLRRVAKDNAAEWLLIRQGGSHEIWSMNGQRIPIPRHAEIDERTARGIIETAMAAAKGERDGEVPGPG